MSVSVASPAQGKKKSLDAEINLVPFIDLLSMCICFLLMTAVWIQIGSVQIKQSHGTEGAALSAQSYELDVQLMTPQEVQVTVKRGAKVAQKITASPTELGPKLESLIKGLGGPKKDLISAAMLTPRQGVSYGDMVGVMDILRKNQIVNLGVYPAKNR